MDLRKQAKAGVIWTTLGTVCIAIIQILRLSILARFLDKSDFGIVAILTFVLGLTNTFADLGFSAAIMHKHNISQKEFSSLYWIQSIFFIILFIIGSLLSPLVAAFYNEESISYLLPIVLLDLLFNGIGRLYDTVLQKDMQFKTIAIRNIVAASSSILIAYILAYLGYGIYSMIFSALFQTAFFNVWNFCYGQRFIKLKCVVSFGESMPLAKIGIFQTGSQLLDYIGSQIDILIIGRLLGTESLGVYNLAKELVMKVILLINSIANKVILPIFSKINNNRDELKSIYCKALSILIKINFPIIVSIFVLSGSIVKILYGDEYSEVGIIISILFIWSMFVCIGNPVANLAISTGRTDLSFKYTIYRVLITIPVIYISSLIDVYMVAFSNSLLSVLFSIIIWRIQISKMIDLSFVEYIKIFKDQMLFAFTIGGVLFTLNEFNVFGCHENPYLNVVFYSSLIALVYFRSCRYLIRTFRS